MHVELRQSPGQRRVGELEAARQLPEALDRGQLAVPGVVVFAQLPVDGAQGIGEGLQLDVGVPGHGAVQGAQRGAEALTADLEGGELVHVQIDERVE